MTVTIFPIWETVLRRVVVRVVGADAAAPAAEAVRIVLGVMVVYMMRVENCWVPALTGMAWFAYIIFAFYVSR